MSPLGAERRDEGAQHDQAGVDHQLRDLADAADILDPVGFGEAEVAVKTMAHIVAVEHVRVNAARVQPLSRRGSRWSICPAPDSPVNHRTAGR